MWTAPASHHSLFYRPDALNSCRPINSVKATIRNVEISAGFKLWVMQTDILHAAIYRLRVKLTPLGAWKDWTSSMSSEHVPSARPMEVVPERTWALHDITDTNQTLCTNAGLWCRQYRQIPMGLRRPRGLRKMAAKYFEHTLPNQSQITRQAHWGNEQFSIEGDRWEMKPRGGLYGCAVPRVYAKSGPAGYMVHVDSMTSVNKISSHQMASCILSPFRHFKTVL